MYYNPYESLNGFDARRPEPEAPAAQPSAEQASAAQTVAEQPTAEQPITEQPSAEQAVTEQTVTEQTSAEVPPVVREIMEQVSDRQSSEQPSAASDSVNAAPVAAVDAPAAQSAPSYSYAPVPDAPDWSRSRRKSRGLGRKLLRCAAAVLLIVGISAGSVAGYIWYENRNAPAVENSLPAVQNPAPADTRVVYYSVDENGSGLTIPQIYEKNRESVVLFTCQVPVSSSGYDSFFYGFDFGFGQPQMPQQSTTATGSGVILSEDGYIITNNHVVADATAITVTLWDGSEYPATVVGADENTDIAVVKIEATGLKAAEFGDSDQLITGELACVIGNPLGADFRNSLTIGYVSATERTLSIQNTLMTLVQIDAAVNPGNSGGALINSRGQVVGIVNAKISADDVEGLGFAVPCNVALQIAHDYIDHGYVASRPWLGISVQSVSQEQAAYYNIDPGITVVDVTAGSCAEKGGLKVGDKILAFNGVKVSTSTELNYQKERCKIGDTVKLTVERDGAELTLSIVLEGQLQTTAQ